MARGGCQRGYASGKGGGTVGGICSGRGGVMGGKGGGICSGRGGAMGGKGGGIGY